MRILKKKIFGIEVAAMFFFISVASGSSFVNQNTINEIGITNLFQEQLNTNTYTFIVEVNPTSRKSSTYEQCSVEDFHGYKVQLTNEQADYLFSTINRLDSAFNMSKNAKEKMKIFEKKLKVLREVDILPSSFTVENMTKTTKWLRGLARESLCKSPRDDSSENHKRNDWDITAGGGFAGLIIAVPFGQVLPVPLGQTSSECKSYEIPLFKTLDNWIFTANFSVISSTAAASWLFTLSAATYGWGFTFLFPKMFFVLGPFYSMWAGVSTLSVTVYWEIYPKVTLLDAGIIGGLAMMLMGKTMEW